MSEQAAPYVTGANRYHALEERTQEAIDAAYHECLTSRAGQIMMDDLYRLVCCTAADDLMTMISMVGQRDLRNHLLDRMRAHERRQEMRWVHDRREL